MSPAVDCPFCQARMNARPFLNARRPGFVFECWGNPSYPHTVKMYLSDFRGDAPFLASLEPSPGRRARAGKLLERAKALSGE